jgi:NDP-sugar pyrophosphorylase family protein
VFTEFLHSRLEELKEQTRQPPLGAFFQEAIARGLRVRGIYFKQGTFMDIGTPRGILQAKRLLEPFHAERGKVSESPRQMNKRG